MKYLGGWKQCLKDHESMVGGRIWYDDHLFRDGAMDPMGIKDLVEKWKCLGFYTHDGVKWIDVCVIEAMAFLASLNDGFKRVCHYQWNFAG